MSKAVRIYYLDILRILAIFLVVVVHTSVLPSHLAMQSFPSFLLFAFAKTCVPLFLMVSGALLLGKQESYRMFFTKRGARILIPWILWCLFFFWLEGGEQGISGVLLTRFWFLPLIAGLYLLTPFFRLALRYAKQRDIVYILLLWFFFISCIPYVRESAAFPLRDSGLVWQTIMYSGYYLLGYALSRAQIWSSKRFVGYVLVICGVFGSVITSGVFGGELLRYYEYISPFTILSSAGIFIFVSSFMAYDSKYHKWIRLLSDASFGVIFTHELVRYILRQYVPSFWQTQVQTAEYTLLRALVVFVLALAIVLVIRKSPVKSLLS